MTNNETNYESMREEMTHYFRRDYKEAQEDPKGDYIKATRKFIANAREDLRQKQSDLHFVKQILPIRRKEKVMTMRIKATILNTKCDIIELKEEIKRMTNRIKKYKAMMEYVKKNEKEIKKHQPYLQDLPKDIKLNILSHIDMTEAHFVGNIVSN